MEVVFLLILATAVRLLTVKDSIVGFDTYGHLYFARALKEQQVGPCGALILRHGTESEFRVPFLWHWILSRLPSDIVRRHHRLINPSADGIFAVLVFYSTIEMGLPRERAFFVFFLYLFTPMWFSRLSMGPRINGLTPRLFSELCVNLFFMATCAPLPIGDVTRVSLGTVFGLIVLLSSKFGIQVLLFMVPLTSVIARDPIGMLALSLAVIAATVLTKGGFWTTLNHQMNHLRHYFWHNLQKKMAVSDRNSIKTFVATLRTGTIGQRIGRCLGHALVANSFTAVLFKLPAAVLVVALCIYGILTDSLSDKWMPLTAPVLAAAIVYALVSFPPLLFLGEAERYLNHVASFIVILLVCEVQSYGLDWILIVLISYGVLFWVAETFILKKFERKSRHRDKVDGTVINYLARLERKHRIAAYPFRAAGGYRILLETEHTLLYPIAWTDNAQRKAFEEYNDQYPYFNLDRFDKMADEYGLDMLIINAQALVAKGDWRPPPRWRRLDIGEPIYEVYQKRD